MLNDILVVKSRSRLGLKHFPFGGDADKSIGVATGANVISQQEFFKQSSYRTIDLNFPNPEVILDANYFAVLAQYLEKGKNQILENLYDETRLLNLGGDHSVAFMSLLAAIERAGDADIGYIQLDSHGDIHSIASSPSGNFHGMWLRPFVGKVGDQSIDSLIRKQLKPENLMYIGNLVIEAAEKEFMVANKIKRYSRSEIQENIPNIFAFINRFDHLHISIDIDGFDKTIAPGTGIKAEHGLFFEDVEFLLQHLHKMKSFSVDIVEYNPEKDIDSITLALISNLLQTIFSNNK